MSTKFSDKVVEALMQQAFSTPRDPRSAEYKAGVRAALKFRLCGAPIEIPYRIGTAQADAFFSGLEEGHSRGRKYLEFIPAEAA